MESKILTNPYEIDRGMFSGAMNPFVGYQMNNKFSNTPYQFTADSNLFSSMGGNNGAGTFDHGFSQLHDNTNGFGLKYGGGSGYGHSAAGMQQTHYGPPILMAGGKAGKLKGAALSALTLLAFLFFLNLLQSCLKDQMEAMNPTVMVMSAGQRMNIARNENEARKRFDQNYENIRSEEQFTEYDDGDYDDYENVDDIGSKNHKRIREKQEKLHKSRAHGPLTSTIGTKLQNLQIVRSNM
ncbi:hypothetical protein PVAND_000108 [Polypedilum vanderplanki]|uniref:Uncharacterized protein n=1 Tax=Polypedilum vanderplanki TaxID=319348 RepID=A0A9J6BJQ7_POLVA|nr:hypothetical protein PVAND_000108 [Polypedilum vanderplanki]